MKLYVTANAIFLSRGACLDSVIPFCTAGIYFSQQCFSPQRSDDNDDVSFSLAAHYLAAAVEEALPSQQSLGPHPDDAVPAV